MTTIDARIKAVQDVIVKLVDQRLKVGVLEEEEREAGNTLIADRLGHSGDLILDALTQLIQAKLTITAASSPSPSAPPAT